MRIYQSSRFAEWRWKFQILNAEILLNRKPPGEVQASLERLAATAPESGLKARALMDLSYVQSSLSHPDRARALLEESRRLAAASRSPLLPSIDLRLGLLESGFDQADAMFRAGLDGARAQGDSFLIASALGNLGYNRLTHGRYDDAISWFEKALAISSSMGLDALTVKTDGNLGWCYYRLGDLDKALKLFLSADSLAEKSGQPYERQRWLGNVGSVYYSKADYDRAISYYQRAALLAQQAGSASARAVWLSNIATVYIEKRDFAAAEKSNNEALALGEAVQNRGYLKLNSASIAANKGQFDGAESVYRGLIQQSQRQPDVLWTAHAQLAWLYRTHAKPAAAEDQYQTALSVIDRAWLSLQRNESKITFLSPLIRFYHDYLSFLSERGQHSKALEVHESSRARLLSQKLEGQSSGLPRFRISETIRLARATDSIFLSYCLAPGRSFLWVVRPSGVEQLTLPPESEIAALAKKYRQEITVKLADPLRDSSQTGQQLYRMLIQPAARFIPKNSRVVIVPDGRLHELNLETLVVPGDRPHYWIEDVTLSVAPSLALLRADRWARSTPNLLLIGDPLEADRNFPRLRYAQGEIQAVVSNFPACRPFTGPEAYPQKFREARPRDFRLIHFTSHADANPDSPLNSAVILSKHEDSYKLYARDVIDQPLQAGVVTISACSSAGAKAYAGEGLMGFAWAFLEAGAHNVIAGIWNIDDATAPAFMRVLYQGLANGRPPPDALRSAKLESLRLYGKPYYWAPFQVFTRYVTKGHPSEVAFFPRATSLPGR